MEKFKDAFLELAQQNKFAQLRDEMSDCNEVDIAEFLETLDQNLLLKVFRILPKEKAATVFSYMEPEQQQHIIESMTDSEVNQIIDEMFMDDTVDFLEEVPAGVVKKVLRATDEQTRHTINQLLNYPDDSAGSIMTVEFADLKVDMTARQALEDIKQTGVDKETIYTCYIIDDQRRLVGTVPLHSLLVAHETTPMRVLMDDHFICVHTLDDRETAADIFRKYHLINMPVVDNEGRLVGIITADDIMEVIEEENTEDIEKMAALTPSEEEYMRSSVLTLAKNRIPWLLILMISAMVSGRIIAGFDHVLQQVVILASFIPMLMDTGGNSGSQASVLIIRGLALGEVHLNDAMRVFWKELRVGLICGVILTVVNFARVILIDRVSIPIALTVCITLLVVVVAAKCIGGTLPILAKALKLDPAMMASPMITTIVDAGALFIYFFIATKLFHLA